MTPRNKQGSGAVRTTEEEGTREQHLERFQGDSVSYQCLSQILSNPQKESEFSHMLPATQVIKEVFPKLFINLQKIIFKSAFCMEHESLSLTLFFC